MAVLSACGTSEFATMSSRNRRPSASVNATCSVPRTAISARTRSCASSTEIICSPARGAWKVVIDQHRGTEITEISLCPLWLCGELSPRESDNDLDFVAAFKLHVLLAVDDEVSVDGEVVELIPLVFDAKVFDDFAEGGGGHRDDFRPPVAKRL